MLALNRYRQTQTETASAPRILVLLFSRARQDMARADEHLSAKRVREASPHLRRATDIVAELLETLDANRAPELAASLSGVYGFVLSRLLRAHAGDQRALAEARRAFTPIADAFEAAVARRGP